MSKAINVLDTLIAIRNATQVNQPRYWIQYSSFHKGSLAACKQLVMRGWGDCHHTLYPRGGWTLLDNMHRRVAVVEVSEQQEDSVCVFPERVRQGERERDGRPSEDDCRICDSPEYPGHNPES